MDLKEWTIQFYKMREKEWITEKRLKENELDQILLNLSEKIEYFDLKLKSEVFVLEAEDIVWLEEALRDPFRKWLAAFVCRDYAYKQSLRNESKIDQNEIKRSEYCEPQPYLPEELFSPLLQAGIDEPDPSDNKYFIKACGGAFDGDRLVSALLDKVETGTDLEKAGAINACYWAGAGGGRKIWASFYPELETILGTEMFNRRCALAERYHNLMLTTFVANSNVHVQRSAISKLKLETPDMYYPEELRPLVEQAIAIARSHSDDYIRRRVEI